MSRVVVNPRIEVEIRTDLKFQAAIEEVGREGLEFAETHVPYDPLSNEEHIRDTLRIERTAEGGRHIVAGTDHWWVPEFGTEDQAARPYLRPLITALGLRTGSFL